MTNSKAKKPNPMRFVNEPNVDLMCAALSRILSAKHDADITITARLKTEEELAAEKAGSSEASA